MPPGLTEAHSTTLDSRLRGVTVYIDRCVYMHPHELHGRNRLVRRIKSMGARIVTALNLADLIVCDGSRTVLDEALRAAPGIRVLSEYIDKAYCAERLPDYQRWTFSNRLVYPYPIKEGEEVSIPSVSAVPDEEDDELEDDELEEDELAGDAEVAQPPPLREGVALVPILKYEVPPRYAFQYQEVRDWSLELVFWFAKYTLKGDPCTRDFINTISTHIYTVTGMPLFPTSFSSHCRDSPPFKEKVAEIVALAHAAAAESPIKPLTGEEIVAFIDDAGARYCDTPGLKQPPRPTPPRKDPASTSAKGRGESDEGPNKRRKVGK
ncbi:hypothetical protein AURDEDRAFT_165711 [Auricularia subglabra TFB-10046 SS5]|nr:hypothetical protein AURDEDRAFT_165711 [Auricularia subglabra TFB-10046 SS5]